MWGAGSPLTIPPSDAEQRRVIEKLAEYCARNGSAFEAVVKRNEAGNPHFRFLSSPNSAEAGYYQHLLNVERDRAARQNSSYHLREGSAPPPPPRPPPHPPPHVQRPPSVPPPPPAAEHRAPQTPTPAAPRPRSSAAPPRLLGDDEPVALGDHRRGGGRAQRVKLLGVPAELEPGRVLTRRRRRRVDGGIAAG